MLRPPGLRQNQKEADHYKSMALHRLGHGSSSLTLDDGQSLLDELLAALMEQGLQERLWKCWADCDYDPARFGAKRLPVILKVQGPIIAKYGFENSPAGVAKSIMAFFSGDEPLNANPEVAFKNDILHYLTDPAKQCLSPIDGEGGFQAEYSRWLAQVRMTGHWEHLFPSPKPVDFRPYWEAQNRSK